MSDMKALYLLVPLAPLAGAILAGLFGKQIGRAGAHVVTILGVAIAFVASIAARSTPICEPDSTTWALARSWRAVMASCADVA